MSDLPLAGLAEVADALGVTKRTASRYTTRRDFPAPLQVLAAGPVWRLEDVRRWGREHLPLREGWREGRRRTTS